MNYRAMTALAAVFVACSFPAGAQDATQDNAPNVATSGDVNLTPRRLVFGPRDRGVKEISVFNRTNGTATYTIVLNDRAMTPDGAIVSVDEVPADEKARLKSASSFIRYSPRQMTLGPHEAQTVRVQVRPPADAALGEYRSHFTVSTTPPPETGVDIAAATAGTKGDELKVTITPTFGIMIPIIVRTGELNAQTSISKVHLVEAQGRRGIGFTINRTGGRSVYGGIDVFLLGSGKEKKIGGIRGLGVYEEIDHRDVNVPLDPNAPAIGPGSRVKIVYTDDELKPGTVLAEIEATLS